MKNILITGASGLIGARLSEMLFERGYKVRHLSRGYKVKGNFPVTYGIQREDSSI